MFWRGVRMAVTLQCNLKIERLNNWKIEVFGWRGGGDSLFDILNIVFDNLRLEIQENLLENHGGYAQKYFFYEDFWRDFWRIWLRRAKGSCEAINKVLYNLRLEILQNLLENQGGYAQKYFFYKIFDEIFEGFDFVELKVGSPEGSLISYAEKSSLILDLYFYQEQLEFKNSLSVQMHL